MMNWLLNLLRQSSPDTCARKVRYPAEASARRASVAMSRKTGTEIEPYKCPHCDGWHIGHRPQITVRIERN
jgi:hypothetical protein